MTIIKEKETIEEPQYEKTIESDLELKKYIGQVKSRINTEITEDFTYAKLDEQNEKGVIEMTTNAFFAIRMYTQAAKKGTKWTWNNKFQQWEQRRFTTEEQEIVRNQGKRLFDALMTRVLMTVIMNRNKQGNYLIDALVKDQRETEQELELKETVKDIQKKARDTGDKN